MTNTVTSWLMIQIVHPLSSASPVLVISLLFRDSLVYPSSVWTVVRCFVFLPSFPCVVSSSLSASGSSTAENVDHCLQLSLWYPFNSIYLALAQVYPDTMPSRSNPSFESKSEHFFMVCSLALCAQKCLSKELLLCCGEGRPRVRDLGEGLIVQKATYSLQLLIFQKAVFRPLVTA